MGLNIGNLGSENTLAKWWISYMHFLRKKHDTCVWNSEDGGI